MKRIVITGPKASGKSNIGSRLAELLHAEFFDLDNMIETVFYEQEGTRLNFREIYRRHGEEQFRELEIESAKRIATMDGVILSTGGTTFTVKELRDILVPDSYVILLKNEKDVLWDRVVRKGMPAYLDGVDNPREQFYERVESVVEAVTHHADMVFDTEELSIEDVAQILDVELMQRNISIS